jgi:hypothetical protein
MFHNFFLCSSEILCNIIFFIPGNTITTGTTKKSAQEVGERDNLVYHWVIHGCQPTKIILYNK